MKSMIGKGVVRTIVRTFGILTKRQRWEVLALVLCYVFTSTVQVAGLGAVLPFFNLILDPSSIEKFSFLMSIQERLNLENSQLAVLVGCGALTLFISGVGLKIATGYWNLVFFARLRIYLSRELFTDFLQSSYIKYLQRSTAEISNTIAAGLTRFVGKYLKFWMNIISQSIMLAFIAGVVIIASPLLSMIFVGLMCVIYSLVYFKIRPRLRWLGKESWKCSIEQGNVLYEAVAGFKEIRVLGRSSFQEDRYLQVQKRNLRVVKKEYFYGDVPAAVILILVMILFFSYLSFSVMGEDRLASNLSLLAFFGLASRQMLPAMKGIFKSFSEVKKQQEVAAYYVKLIGRVRRRKERIARRGREHFAEGQREAEGNLAFVGAISFDRVTFAYPGRDRAGIFDVDLTIRKNSSVAFVGSTGAGKSTLADLLLGVIEADEGSLRIDDTVLTELTLPAWQRKIGYVPQAIFLANASIRENIALGLPGSEIEEDRVEAAARSAQLHDFILDELPHGYDTLVGERGLRISGGQRQRIGIARALYHNPSVMIFDEATSALDNETESAVMEAIDAMAGNKTVILIAHRLTTVQHCENIVVLERGEIVQQGTFDALAGISGNFREMLGSAAPALN